MLENEVGLWGVAETGCGAKGNRKNGSETTGAGGVDVGEGITGAVSRRAECTRDASACDADLVVLRSGSTCEHSCVVGNASTVCSMGFERRGAATGWNCGENVSREDELLGACHRHGDTSATGGGSTSTIEMHSRVAGNVRAACGAA